MKYYISIEKNTEGFDLYKVLWKKLGVDGIRAGSMTDGIKKAVMIEKSTVDELYFIDIVADSIDYMAQLKFLSEQTNAPILVATSNYTEAEHHEALNNGTDFFAGYCETPEQNITGVITSISSMERRANKKKVSSGILAHRDILISRDAHKAFVSDKEIQLTKIEMEILHYFMLNKGLVLTHEQIRQQIWTDEDEASTDSIYNNMKRLRDKLRSVSQKEYIETLRDVGYRLIGHD